MDTGSHCGAEPDEWIVTPSSTWRILVGTTSLVTGISLTEAKRGGNGKAKAKGKGKGKSKGKGSGTDKVQFCHRSKKGQSFELITVGSPAATAHLNHGDTQCEAGACQTGQATGCNARPWNLHLWAGRGWRGLYAECRQWVLHGRGRLRHQRG